MKLGFSHLAVAYDIETRVHLLAHGVDDRLANALHISLLVDRLAVHSVELRSQRADDLDGTPLPGTPADFGKCPEGAGGTGRARPRPDDGRRQQPPGLL
jgi:hypothetical protein